MHSRGAASAYGGLAWTILTTALATTACDSDRKRSPTASEAIAARVARGPFTDVEPSDLAIEYRTNSVRADERFKGVVLRVTGAVERVGQDADGVPLVVMHDHGGDALVSEIRCAWGGDRASAARLDLDVGIVLVGVGAGEALGEPLLVGCRLDNVVGSKDPPAKVEQRDFANDPFFWRSNVDMFIRNKDVRYTLTYKGNDATIVTNQCDRAKLGVTQIGALPHGYTVTCTDGKTTQWTLPEVASPPSAPASPRFYCIGEKDGGGDVCGRTKEECAKIFAEFSFAPGIRGCEPQASAWCFTFVDGGQTKEVCAANSVMCSKLETDARERQDTKGVTTCKNE